MNGEFVPPIKDTPYRLKCTESVVIDLISAPFDKYFAPARSVWILEQGKHTASLQRFGNFKAKELHQRSADIDMRNEAGRGHVRWCVPRPLHEERYSRNLVIHRRPLVRQPVRFQKDTVIAGIHQHCPWCALLDFIQHTADLVIDERVRSEEMLVSNGWLNRCQPSIRPHALLFGLVL